MRRHDGGIVAVKPAPAGRTNGPKAKSVPLTQLRPADWNPRTISDERFRNLCRSIEADPDFLWRRPVLAQADGTIYAGNMRFRAAQHLGMATIPAVVEDVSDQLARERAIRDNRQWGDDAEDELATLLDRLRAEGSDLDLLGFDERALQQLLDRLEPQALADPDEVPALPEEPVTQPGDLWLLGDHRVACGDSTDPDAVARVMGAATASCVWTDPPYGVDYVGGTEKKLTIKNDTPDGLNALLAGAFAAVDPILADGAAIYIAHPTGPLAMTFMSNFVARGWRFHQSLVWVKDSLVPGHSDYQMRHEGVLFGYKGAQGRRGRGARGWYGDNSATSVFEVPRPKASPDHPTSKPVDLITPMLRNSSRSGEIILDPFLGSGSTLIAADQLGRRCYGLELDPRYCDVAVRRWEQVNGKKAERG
jgi:DNA modification methylase